MTPGILTVDMVGPSQVSLECKEFKTGYQIFYKTNKSGIYYITVKYNNQEINGSPFMVSSI